MKMEKNAFKSLQRDFPCLLSKFLEFWLGCFCLDFFLGGGVVCLWGCFFLFFLQICVWLHNFSQVINAEQQLSQHRESAQLIKHR